MLKKLWKDPVWSNVIAASFFAALVGIGTYLLNWWAPIKSFLISIYTYLGSTTELVNWVIGLMMICTIFIAILVVVLLWQLPFPSNSDLSWRSYTDDVFFKLKWKWSYDSVDSISNLHSLCPHCLYQVYSTDASAYGSLQRITYRCDSCGSTFGPFEEDQYSLEDKVKRFIQQKLRTGRWSENENS